MNMLPQKSFWAHNQAPHLSPNPNSFNSLFHFKFNNFLFFRSSSYNRAIKQFVLQSLSSCQTPLDYFSMLWSSSVDTPTNFFVQRFASSLHHNSTGQQQLNYLTWLPGTVSNFHKIRAVALQNRADLRLLASLRRLEAARLGGGNNIPLVFRDLGVLPDPTYLFSITSRSTFNEVVNLRLPLASLQNVLSGFDPMLFGRVRPVLQLPYSSSHNKVLRLTHFSLFRDAAVRSWKQVWLRHSLLNNFLSFKQRSSYLRRYILTVRTRPAVSLNFSSYVPNSFSSVRWLLPFSSRNTSLFNCSWSRLRGDSIDAPRVTTVLDSTKSTARRFFVRRSFNVSYPFLRHLLFRSAKRFLSCRQFRFSFSNFFFTRRLAVRHRQLISSSLPSADFAAASSNSSYQLSQNHGDGLNTAVPALIGFSPNYGYRLSSSSFRPVRRPGTYRQKKLLNYSHVLSGSKLFFSPSIQKNSNQRGVLGTSHLVGSRKNANNSFSRNIFFRFSSARPFVFSRLRRFKRFYRKRWSLFARTSNMLSRSLNSQIPSCRLLSTPSSFSLNFVYRSRFVTTQILRTSKNHKQRFLRLFKSFSLLREHPALRLGSRRHFRKFFVNTGSEAKRSLVQCANSSNSFLGLPSGLSLRHPAAGNNKSFGVFSSVTATYPPFHNATNAPLLPQYRLFWYSQLLFFNSLLRSGEERDSSSSFFSRVSASRVATTTSALTPADVNDCSWTSYWPWFFSSSWPVPLSVVPTFPPLPSRTVIKPRRPLSPNLRFSLQWLRLAHTSKNAFFRMVRNMQRIRNPGVNFFRFYRFSSSFVSRRFVVSLARCFYNKRRYSKLVSWSSFFFPSFFRPFVRFRSDRRLWLVKKTPFIRRRSLVRRWRRCRFILRRQRWKPQTSRIFSSSFYRPLFKHISSPIADRARRYMYSRAARSRRRAKVLFRVCSGRNTIFPKYLAYRSFSRRVKRLSFRTNFIYSIGSRYSLPSSLNLRFFREFSAPKRWWLRRIRGRFYPRVRGSFRSRKKRSRFFVSRRAMFRRRRFIKRYRLLRFSGFFFSRISPVRSALRRPLSLAKLTFFRSIKKSFFNLRSATSFRSSAEQELIFKLLMFLKLRQRRFVQRRINARFRVLDRVLSSFQGSSVSKVFLPQKKITVFKRRSRFFFLQALLLRQELLPGLNKKALKLTTISVQRRRRDYFRSSTKKNAFFFVNLPVLGSKRIIKNFRSRNKVTRNCCLVNSNAAKGFRVPTVPRPSNFPITLNNTAETLVVSTSSKFLNSTVAKKKYISVRTPKALKVGSEIKRSFSSCSFTSIWSPKKTLLTRLNRLHFVLPSRKKLFTRRIHFFNNRLNCRSSFLSAPRATRNSTFFSFSPSLYSLNNIVFSNFLTSFPFSGFALLFYLRRFYKKPSRRIPFRFFIGGFVSRWKIKELSSFTSWRKLCRYDRWFFRSRFSNQKNSVTLFSSLPSIRTRRWRRFQHVYSFMPWRLSRRFRVR